MSGLDADEVRASLQASSVLQHYGWKFRKSGSELESTSCPNRGDHSRRALLVNARTGRWQCFPCGTSGDLFSFIAAVERMSLPSEFRKVLDKAAEIAGIGPSDLTDDERRQRAADWARKREQDEADERRAIEERDARAVDSATRFWGGLSAKNVRGFDYLCERRVGDVILLEGVVRFDDSNAGSPCVRLFSSKGEVRNVVSRRLPELGEPKTPGLFACPSAGTLIDSITDIRSGQDVVLTEGVMDSITAKLVWREAVVLGAHGAGNLSKVATVAAPVVVKARARMLLVPHHDKAGCLRAIEAGKAAQLGGLSIAKGTLAVVKHGQKDLNDAWRGGWRAA